jgi:anhydro-N-acetylmuramic acid kinase
VSKSGEVPRTGVDQSSHVEPDPLPHDGFKQAPHAAHDRAPPVPFGRAIGVMSGTSCDGVDALMLQLDDLNKPHVPTVLCRSSVAFPAALQQELLQPHKLSTQRICELQFALPEYYVQAIKALPDYATARVCGVHGQTVWHQTGPDAAVHSTLQLGSSAVVAQHTGIPTVGDMRAADVAQGGLGAPIAPLAHWFFSLAGAQPCVVVNFGGMCNLTHVTFQASDVTAYDVGPGMVLSDAYVQHSTDGAAAFDTDGAHSRGGQCIEALVQRIVAHPYVSRPPPKSTGREDFGQAYLQGLLQEVEPQHTAVDINYTLLFATASILKLHIEHDPRIAGRFAKLVLTGGGALNPTLVQQVRQLFPTVTVEVQTQGVFAPQNHEPAAMALIAARTLCGLPSNLPQVTGARRSVVLGHLCVPTRVSGASDLV